METLEINDTRISFMKRSNYILEQTKNNFEKYEKERHILFELTQDNNVNYILWEHIINCFEAIINLDKNINIAEKDLKYLNNLSCFLRTAEYEDNQNKIFNILDTDNNSYLFLSKQKAAQHLKKNKELFSNNIINEIVYEFNELENILDIIKRNF